MVTLFRRHEASRKCKYLNRKKYPEPRKGKDCSCVMAMDGFVTTPDGIKIPMRGSLGTRSWKDAETILSAKLHPYLRGETVQADITVDAAVQNFLRTKKNSVPARADFGGVSESVRAFRDRTGRNPDDEQEQVRKYTDVLTPLKKFCHERGLILLKQISTEDLEVLASTWKGRSTWKGGVIVGHEPKTQGGKQRYQQNLTIFFNHAVDREWIVKNPASKLDKITVTDSVIEPFTVKEWSNIFSKIEPTFPKIHKMVRAFVLVLRESALRLGDVVKLRPQDITPAGEIEITTEKTDEYVWVTLPEEVLVALNGFEPKSQKYFFWTGNGQLETAKKDWSENMLRLFRAANVQGGISRRSHNFRKTLAVSVAEEGGLDAAMILLAHKSIKTTQKHYAKFTAGRKDKVREALKTVRAKEKLNKLE